jgi:hypothetical protein
MDDFVLEALPEAAIMWLPERPIKELVFADPPPSALGSLLPDGGSELRKKSASDSSLGCCTALPAAGRDVK